MDIIKLYDCLSNNEKAILKKLVSDELNEGKTDILVFIDKYKEDIVHSIQTALKGIYYGKYKYQCLYIEDLNVQKLSRFSGIGENRIMHLDYLINKHKNR